MIVVPLQGLRAYQQGHVRNLVGEYLSAEREELAIEAVPGDGGRTLLRLPQLSATLAPSIRADYLVTEISPRHCEVRSVPITFRYVTPSGWNDFSKQMPIDLDTRGGTMLVFFPAYSNAYSYFAGVELDASDTACVSRVSRLRHAERFPLFVGLLLPPDWSERRLFHTIRDWEIESPLR